MKEKFLPLAENAIFGSFLLLALITPLIFSNFNTELFEVPKMHFVYAISTALLFLTIVKFILSEKIAIPKNLPIAAFTAFVFVQLVSTFFSIDKFTSVFGFPSRLNGGLASQIAYLVIFASALISLDAKKTKQILASVVIAALFVSLWGIPSHFGFDPSCFALTGEFNALCWKKDFDPQLRIFSTLGQPNWLASYLVLTLTLSLVFLLTFKKHAHQVLFFVSSIAIFWALLLTNSRSGILGLAISLAIFLLFVGKIYLKKLVPTLIIFAVISLFFSTILTTRIKSALTSTSRMPTTVNQNQTADKKPTQTALEADGTESGQIRLIIWQGAFKIFKNWPILGSGPETFVSSYFMFRPASHNLTSEWEFFYNKAHNEFLNTLANTGTLGFLTYIAFLISAIFSIFKIQKVSIAAKAIFAATIGYLATIFFGFSTVATQTVFFLLIASSQTIAGKPQNFEINIKLKENFKLPLILTTALIFLFISSFVLRLYMSNIFEKRAENFKSEDSEKELLAYENAARTHFWTNPYLLSNYSQTIALIAASSEEENQKKELTSKSDSLTQKSLNSSPNNFLIAQRAARTYAILAGIDENYVNKAQNTTELLIKLAPNYPTTYLTNAKIYIILENEKAAISALEKTLQLKPEYLEARQLLDQVVNKSLQ